MTIESTSQKQNKKTTITLSIDTNVLNAIREEADSTGISLNSRINLVLEKYVSFYKQAEKLESCILPYNQFAKMLNLMDERSLAEIISTDGNAHVISAMQHNGLPMNMDSLIGLFKTGLRYTGAYSSFHHYVDENGQLCLVFDHKFGLKWSNVLATATSNLVDLALHCPTETKILPYTVLVRVKR